MKLDKYPVLQKEFSLSKVITEDEEDIILYNTATGVKAYPHSGAYQFQKRCRGNKTLREIILELSCISGEPFEKIQKDLSPLVKKMADNRMLIFLSTPLNAPRPEPAEVSLYSRIENVSLEITRKCNLRCKHCYSNSGIKRENELTFKEIKELIDDLAAAAVLNITLTGGEPLLHPHIFDVISYIRSSHLSCIILSNGTLITNEVVNRLKDIGILGVAISIDGATDETNDSFRGVPKSFEKVVHAIKMLQAAGIPVRGNISIHKENLHEFSGILNLLEQLHITNYRVRPISYSGRSEESDIFIAPEDFVEVLKKLRQYEIDHGEEVQRKHNHDPRIKNCGIGLGSIAITSNGNVVPCPPFPDNVSLDNIRETPIAEIWNNSPFLNSVRRISASENDECKTCAHVTVCKGGCIADVFARTGKLDCGDVFDCAYFQVYHDYIPVEIGKQSILSVEIR